MPWELYWHGSIENFFVYAQKENISIKAKQKELDAISWLNGIYVEKALFSVLNMFFSKNKKSSYPTKPILLKEELTEQQKYKKQETIRKIEEHNLLMAMKYCSKKEVINRV